ncbi:hypothetical protein TrVFT333_011782 [Trichoderma virens FT-333]|nr:hypothetical protein TrVFT333_011782 [Trichoderma virens FT-333]
MGDIYKGADRVIFRLGPGSDETNAFMESLQWLQKESIKHACKAWSPQDDRWKNFWTSFQPVSGEIKADLENLQRQGLQEILEQPWFRRVWILQEVAFAKAGIISCGTRSVSARLFSLTPLLLRVIPDAHCQSVLDIMPSLWREFTWWSESRSLYRLLLNFGRSEATEPRDLIYALRGMASDMEKNKAFLVPDYEKAENALIDDVIRYIYHSDLTWWPRPSSIRELLRDLPTLGTNFCMEIGKKSLPSDMEMLLQNPEILVSQEIIKAAAQYDKTGEVVEVLLLCRGGDFKIDEEVLICAATNLIGAGNALEAFWRYQNQLAVTEQILIAAAENSTSGDSAMRFLLSIETQDYDVTSILEAVARNRSEYLKAEIIRILLGKKDNNTATISELLVAAAEIQYYGSYILMHFVQKHTDFEIAEHAITAAMKSWRGGVDCLQLLLRYCASYVTITEGIIQAAYDSPDHGFNAIKLLLGNPAVYWRLSPDQRVAALVQISDKASVQHPNPWETLAQEIVDKSSAYCRKLTLGLLLEGKEGLFDEDTVSSILKRYGTRVIEDLFILRRKQAIISKTCVLVLLQEIKAEEAEWIDMERKYASRANASQFKSNEEEQYWAPWIRSDEDAHLEAFVTTILRATYGGRVVNNLVAFITRLLKAAAAYDGRVVNNLVAFITTILKAAYDGLGVKNLEVFITTILRAAYDEGRVKHLEAFITTILRAAYDGGGAKNLEVPGEEEEERRAWAELLRPKLGRYLSGEESRIWMQLCEALKAIDDEEDWFP